VKLLLGKGADVKSKDGGGQTPLSRTVKGGHRARGGCEAATQEGRRETSILEKTEKALLIILSSFRTFTFCILWWKGRRIQPPEPPFSAANTFGLLAA
jgi:hypothetical protein